MKQKTLAEKLTISGIGIHSGKEASITLLPSERGVIEFTKPMDQNKLEQPRLEANYRNVIATNLGTTIGMKNSDANDGALFFKILTIEHLMASLWACDIDSVLISMNDGDEIPILDGSSKQFIEQLKKVGIKSLDRERKSLHINKTIEVEDLKSEATLEIVPADNFSIALEVSYDYMSPADQSFYFSGSKEEFFEQLMGARTFCSLEDVKAMRSMGLARGGNLNNSMVFYNKQLLNANDDIGASILNELEIVNNNEEKGDNGEGKFRYENEVVRHKVLDCVGDMFTSGFIDIRGAIRGVRSGHGLNNKLLKKIFAEESNYSIK